MTTDIARMDTNAVAVLGTAGEALDRLGRWVAAARDAHALVSPLVDTAFVPEAYKPKVDPRATDAQKAEARAVAVANATAAVLQGITLGLDPLTALQQIYIVHGRPGMYTEIKVALVKSRGHEVWTEDISDTRAVVCGRRAGTDYVERVTVTMDQARKAGWTTNQAYTKTPQDMLYARAAGRVCDRVAPDVLMGIASVEEIRDSIQTTAEVGNGHRTVAPRRKQSASVAIETAEEPQLEEEPPWPTIPDPTPPAPTASPKTPGEPTSTSPTPAETARAEERAEAEIEQYELESYVGDQVAVKLSTAGDITGAQSRMMYGLLRQSGREDRDVALVYISGVIGREIGSTKELSKGEAKKVIDALNTAEPPLDDDFGA